jgi:DNA-binding PadR family transcriptional regulator
MSNIFNIELKNGKPLGLLSIYILHSISIKPKTGYELISEIKEKTEGVWIPSKGTIYPLLKNLKEDNLISIKQIGERSKQIFMVTKEGKKILTNAKKLGKKIEENFLKFRRLVAEIGEFKNEEIVEFLFHIRTLSISKSELNNKGVKNILENCVKDLEKI